MDNIKQQSAIHFPDRAALAVMAALCFCSLGCQKISTGSSGGTNDVDPGWTVVATGSFNSGAQVSGAVQIEQEPGTTNYVARLTGLSCSNSVVGAYIAVTANSSQVIDQALESLSGNQNYYFSTAGSPNWQTATIQSSGYSPTVYGTATLSP